MANQILFYSVRVMKLGLETVNKQGEAQLIFNEKFMGSTTIKPKQEER